MKLFCVIYQHELSDEPSSELIAHKEYNYDVFRERVGDEVDILECYEVDEVDGYKIRLEK